MDFPQICAMKDYYPKNIFLIEGNYNLKEE